jgi:hypothetical protein
VEGDGHRAVHLSAAWIGLAAAAVVMLFIARDLKFQASHSGLEGMGAGIMLLLIYGAAGLIGLIAGIITLKTDGAISRTLFAIAAGAMIGTGIGQVTGPTYQPPQYYAASARVTVDISEPVELTSVDGLATCGSVANGTRIAQVNAYLGRIGPDRVALTLSLDSTSLEVGPYSSTGAASLTVAASADNRSGTVDFRGLVLRASDAPLRIAGRPSSISGRVEWSCAGTVIESWGDAPTLAPVPTNDDLADALVITGSTFEDTRSVERASLEPGEGVPCARGLAGDGAPTDRRSSSSRISAVAWPLGSLDRSKPYRRRWPTSAARSGACRVRLVGSRQPPCRPPNAALSHTADCHAAGGRRGLDRRGALIPGVV